MTTEERILQSAMQTFSRRGYKNSAVKEIAEKADVNALTIFRYFHDKETLFLTAVHRELPSRFDGAATDAKLSFRDAEADLAVLARAYVEELSDKIELMRVFIGEAMNFDALRREAWFVSPVLCAHFVSYVRRLETRTAFAEQNAETLAEMFVSFLTKRIMPVSKAGGKPQLGEEQPMTAELAGQLRSMARWLCGA